MSQLLAQSDEILLCSNFGRYQDEADMRRFSPRVCELGRTRAGRPCWRAIYLKN